MVEVSDGGRRGVVRAGIEGSSGPKRSHYRGILPQAGRNGDGFCIATPAKPMVAFVTGRAQIQYQFKEKPVQIRPENLGTQRPARTGRPLEDSSQMAEKLVAKASEMKDGERRIVFVGDNEIGVFRHEGRYYAYSNFCLHQGGPACEGLTIAKVEERLRPDKTSQGLYFSETEMNFVCPWHGMEYDMKTGECISDRRMKLKKFQVLEKGDEIYVVA
jgi:nitrite reductase/ring-hydroxylating ferredoxin subunit